jgi:pimeloyl-ACP methyl ester carboxylesterase
MRLLFLKPLVFLFFTFHALAQDSLVYLVQKEGKLEGSLCIAPAKQKTPVVLLLAGSGPTDRNGNQFGLENNSLQMIARMLQTRGISSLRVDKRGIGESKDALQSERSITIDTYVEDVKQWIKFLDKTNAFGKIIVAGHSEGALIGLLASVKNKLVNGYISIAGAGRSADDVIKEQFSKVPDNVKEIIFPLIDRLKNGDSISNVPPTLYMLFRPSVQPYMRSWFKYNPCTELKKLNVPVLVVQGNKDIQVKTKDAELLAAAKPEAQLRVIENMNHVLKFCDSEDKEKQMETYDNATLPLHDDLIKYVTAFMQQFRQ